MFLVVSWSDVHFGFERPFFGVPDQVLNKIAPPKSRAPRKKFFYPEIRSGLKNRVEYTLHRNVNKRIWFC